MWIKRRDVDSKWKEIQQKYVDRDLGVEEAVFS
jgi:hypothetical protein